MAFQEVIETAPVWSAQDTECTAVLFAAYAIYGRRSDVPGFRERGAESACQDDRNPLTPTSLLSEPRVSAVLRSLIAGEGHSGIAE